MQERHINFASVRAIVESGEIIETRDEQDETVYVLLGNAGGRALHVVIAPRSDTRECNVKTAYDPDPNEWTAEFRRRKR